MSKKLFRPPPQYDMDSDEDDSSDEDDDEPLMGTAPAAPVVARASGNIPSKSLKRPAPADDDGEDDDDDDDDSEDDDDDDDSDEDDDDEEEEELSKKRRPGSKKKAGSGRRPKSKKPRVAQFIDMEAEASDDDDEEEDERRRGGAAQANRDKGEQMDEEALELIRRQDRRREQAGGMFTSDRSAAEIAADLEDRHIMQNRTMDRTRILTEKPRGKAAAAQQPQQRRPGSAKKAGNSANGAGGSRAASSGSGMVDDDDDDFIEDDIGVGGGGAAGYTAPAEPAGVYTAVAQQSLVPSVSDPSFWMVSCLTGKEAELVLQIMNKCAAFARQNRPLGICGAIAAQSKGKIYIESFSEPAAKAAIENIRGIMANQMRLVPIKDMTTVMTVQPTKKPVRKNEWVRMTRGHYKGDLALVKEVKEGGLKCIVQCVPRLDLTLADLPPEEARVRRRTVRPPQKFFSSQEVAALGRQSLRRQRFPGLDMYCDYFEGNYYSDGYLLKEMTVGSMVKPCGDGEPPTLDELQGFQRRSTGGKHDDDEGADNDGSKMAASLLDELSALQGRTGVSGSSSSNAAGLIIGDTIEVIEGDLIGMRGKLTSLDASTVKVRPLQEGANAAAALDEIEFLANQVRKHIPVGAHVKVTDGRYANETGTVVAVEQLDGGAAGADNSTAGAQDFTAIILTDVTNKEISVRTSQLRESTEEYSGQDKLQGYELYDLVVLSGGGSTNEVGVIVRVGREDFTVVNNNGIAREVRPEELRGKKNSTSNRAVSLDVQGNQIRCGDSVAVAEGPHKGKIATIKRMSRSQLFLHSQTRSEHAGIFVVRSRSCMLAGQGSSGGNKSRSGPGGESPFASPQSFSGGGRAGGGPPAGGRKGADGVIGKTVKIQKGRWKGYLGTVSDATAVHLQVELHSRLKKVMVVRDHVAVAGDKFGATAVVGGGDDGTQTGTETLATNVGAGAASAAPLGGATPGIHAFGGATPHHDGMQDGTDEVWRPGGTIDQTDQTQDHDETTTVTTKNDDDGWGASSSNQQDGAMDTHDHGWGSAAAASSQANDQGGTGTWEPSGTTDNSHTAASGGYDSMNTGGNFQQPRVKRETTAADIDADVEETPAWFMERVCVEVKSTGKAAVIKDINADKTAVVELEDKSQTQVRASDLTMIQPKEHDAVLVAGGNEVGLEGTMVCVDGSDAILKQANEEFKIIDFVHLVKISSLDS